MIRQIQTDLLSAGIVVRFLKDGKPFRLGETIGVLKTGEKVEIAVRVTKDGRMPLIIHATATKEGEKDVLNVLKPSSTAVVDTDHAYFVWTVPFIGESGKKGRATWPANRLYALVEVEERGFELYRLGVITQDDRDGRTYVTKAWSEKPIKAEMHRDFNSGELVFGNLGAGLLWRATLDKLDESGRFNHLPIHETKEVADKTAPKQLIGCKPGTGVVNWFSPFHGLGYGYFVNANGDIEEGRIRFAELPFNDDGVRTIEDGAWFFANKIGEGTTGSGKDANILRPELQQIELIDAPVPVTA